MILIAEKEREINYNLTAVCGICMESSLPLQCGVSTGFCVYGGGRGQAASKLLVVAQCSVRDVAENFLVQRQTARVIGLRRNVHPWHWVLRKKQCAWAAFCAGHVALCERQMDLLHCRRMKVRDVA